MKSFSFSMGITLCSAVARLQLCIFEVWWGLGLYVDNRKAEEAAWLSIEHWLNLGDSEQLDILLVHGLNTMDTCDSACAEGKMRLSG